MGNRKKVLQINVVVKENWFCYCKRYMCTLSLFGSVWMLIFL